jgi:hypothetical protein
MEEQNLSSALNAVSPIFGAFPPWYFVLIIFGLVILIKILDQESTKFFARRNKVEIFTTILAVIGFGANYYFVTRPGLTFSINIAISLATMVVLIYSKTRERDFYFISLKRNKDKEDWIGDGTFQYERTHKAYTITNSDSGVIFSKSLTWNDYKLEFDFKILKTSLGVILRATNLSNLVMLQILDSGIRPHIRVNGFWQFWEPEDSRLEFQNKLNLDNWYSCLMECDKGSIRIRIFEWKERTDPEDIYKKFYERNPVFDRVWKIPTGHIEYSTEQESLMGKIIKNSVPFPINLEYGTFGFRNHGLENALVKNVLIEKI